MDIIFGYDSSVSADEKAEFEETVSCTVEMNRYTIQPGDHVMLKSAKTGREKRFIARYRGFDFCPNEEGKGAVVIMLGDPDGSGQ